jgi:hypothetical protein
VVSCGGNIIEAAGLSLQIDHILYYHNQWLASHVMGAVELSHLAFCHASWRGMSHYLSSSSNILNTVGKSSMSCPKGIDIQLIREFLLQTLALLHL